MTETNNTQQCTKCHFEFPQARISCPSCGMPVEQKKSNEKPVFVKFFIALVIFCALVILIAPR